MIRKTTYIRVDPRDLSAGDILDSSMGLYRIVSLHATRGPAPWNQRQWDVQGELIGSGKPYQTVIGISANGMVNVFGGPKLDAARAGRGIRTMAGRPTWVGEAS